MKALALILLAGTASAATIELKPQAGVDLVKNCGTVNTSVYVTEFTPQGTLAGYVQAWSLCGTTRYNRRTYTRWWSIEWDLAGNALLMSTPDYVSLLSSPDLRYAGYRAYEGGDGAHTVSYLVTPGGN